MPARSRNSQPDPEPELDEDPYYLATEDLYVGNVESGAMPALAYKQGDRVVPDVIDANNWHRQVEVPEKFAGHLDLPEPPGGSPAEAGPDHPSSSSSPSSASSSPSAAAQATTPHAGNGTEE